MSISQIGWPQSSCDVWLKNKCEQRRDALKRKWEVVTQIINTLFAPRSQNQKVHIHMQLHVLRQLEIADWNAEIVWFILKSVCGSYSNLIEMNKETSYRFLFHSAEFNFNSLNQRLWFDCVFSSAARCIAFLEYTFI